MDIVRLDEIAGMGFPVGRRIRVTVGEEEMVLVFTFAPAGTVGYRAEESAGRLC